MKQKLAIIVSHPIQYYSPLFKQLNERGVLDLKIFYTCYDGSRENNYDSGFGKVIVWDIPLLEGYPYEIIENASPEQDPHRFKGIFNRNIIIGVKAYEPDAILVFGWAFHGHLKVLWHFSKKIPVLFRGDSTLLDEQLGIRTIARSLFLRWLYRHVDIAFYVGKNNYNYYRKFGLKRSQLVWAPHAIDNNRFIQDREEHVVKARALRKQMNIGENDFVFLFAGKLEAKKNPFLLLNAFLTGEFANNVHLVYVGNGELEGELQSEALNNRNIHFMDFQNQLLMPAVYRLADVFVLPSAGPQETWGLAVNEAMACERAVIVSDKCGCAVDLVDNGENGYVFRSGDISNLRLRMLELSHRFSLAAAMGKESLKKIGHYTYPQICDAIENEVLKTWRTVPVRK